MTMSFTTSTWSSGPTKERANGVTRCNRGPSGRGPSHTTPIRDRKTIFSSVPGGRLSGMTGSDPKADLRRYLQVGRDALLWKLDGLSDYDIRRPVTPTGTNLLGLIKHVASVELGYLGDTFGRPSGEPLPWLADGAEPNADMWATADESRDQ